MTTPPGARIGTAEREHAMAELARHYTDGRLDHEEYDERLDAVWTARTGADLAILFEDLPAASQPLPGRTRLTPEQRPHPRPARRGPRPAAGLLLAALAVAVGVVVLGIAGPLLVVALVVLGAVHLAGRRGCAGRRHPHRPLRGAPLR